MAIDSINSNVNNNINNINNTQSSSLEKIATGLKINQAADDASSLLISESLQSKRSGLAQSLENLNQGIALSNIATNGLQNQQDILSDVRTDLLQANNDATSFEGRDAIKEEALKLIDQFKNIADTTKFDGQNLLRPNTPGETVDISTDDETLSIEIPDTATAADNLRSLIEGTDFKTGDIGAIIDEIDSVSQQVGSSLSDFGSSQNQLESSARNSITEQVNTARANSSLTDIDFGAEVTDFSKTNIASQIGYLVSTQANAVQEQNVKLLA